MNLATEIRNVVRQELKVQVEELKKLILGRGIIGNWVSQEMACMMLGVGVRRLSDIRIHHDKNGNKVGSIRWRKSKGREVQYHKADIEKYLNHITVS